MRTGGPLGFWSGQEIHRCLRTLLSRPPPPLPSSYRSHLPHRRPAQTWVSASWGRKVGADMARVLVQIPLPPVIPPMPRARGVNGLLQALSGPSADVGVGGRFPIQAFCALKRAGRVLTSGCWGLLWSGEGNIKPLPDSIGHEDPVRAFRVLPLLAERGTYPGKVIRAASGARSEHRLAGISPCPPPGVSHANCHPVCCSVPSN